MSLVKEQIEKPKWKKPKAGVHKWLKQQLNRYIRRNKFDMPIKGKFRPTSGWEY